MHRKWAFNPQHVCPRAPLSTSVSKESWSSEETNPGRWQIWVLWAVQCYTFRLALENLHLKKSHQGNEPPLPWLWWHPNSQCHLCSVCQWKWATTILGLFGGCNFRSVTLLTLSSFKRKKGDTYDNHFHLTSFYF